MKVKNKDRIKRQNKKTIRSEMVNMLVWTSIMTMLLVGGGLSVIIFQWSSIALREDMDFYMESVEKQFTNHLLFWERSVIYLSENENMNYFFRTGSTEGIEKVMKQGVNLFSNQNMVSDTFPIVSDYYVFSKNIKTNIINFLLILKNEQKSYIIILQYKYICTYVAYAKHNKLDFTYLIRKGDSNAELFLMMDNKS